jgi:hypothetical protein
MRVCLACMPAKFAYIEVEASHVYEPLCDQLERLEIKQSEGQNLRMTVLK